MLWSLALACSGRANDTAPEECLRCGWEEMVCGDAPSKDPIEPSCPGAPLDGTALCDGCSFPVDAVISLFAIEPSTDGWHGAECANSPLGADGRFEFDRVAPRISYQLRYDRPVIDDSGATCDGGGDIFELCGIPIDKPNEPLVAVALCPADSG